MVLILSDVAFVVARVSLRPLALHLARLAGYASGRIELDVKGVSPT